MHVNTILWHQMWQLPFKAILAEKDLLLCKDICLGEGHASSLVP